MKSIQVRNFRSFQDSGKIEFKSINLFLGKNSSGKSSILRLFPLFKQSILHELRGPLMWYDETYDFGSFSNVLSRHSIDDGRLKFIIDICQNEKLTNITFNTIQTIILSNAKFPIKPQKSLFSSIAKLNEIIFNELIIFTGKNKNIFTRNITYYIKHYRSLAYRSVIKLLEKYCDKSIRPNTPESEISSCTECIKYPFLPEPLGKNIALTVVLDLDDTLINFVMGPCNSKGMLRIRPGFVEFLEKIKNLRCEIVLFTAATQDVNKIKMM